MFLTYSITNRLVLSPTPPNQALQIKKKKKNWQNKRNKLFKPQGNPGIQIRFQMTLLPLKLLLQ